MEFEPSNRSERQFRSEYNQHFLRGVEEFFQYEFEHDAELRAEVEDFFDYAYMLFHMTQGEGDNRQSLTHVIHHALDTLSFPSLPITLPPVHRRMAVGEHMVITSGYPARECWPDVKKRLLMIPEDVEVTGKTSLGKIDIVRNLPRMKDENGAMFHFARHLLRSTTDSLIELARLSERGSDSVGGIEVYGGVSHLARMANRLHFSVFPIADRRERAQATAVSKVVAQHVVGGVKAWQELEQNYKPAEVAFISRDYLITHFGSEAIAKGFVPPRG
jgi:hypothetical protein